MIIFQLECGIKFRIQVFIQRLRIEIGNEEYRSVENETLLTFFLIDELINISYNMANIY